MSATILPILKSIYENSLLASERVAVRDGAAMLTYGELVANADVLAAQVAVLPEPDLPVGIYAAAGAEYVVAVLALLMAGRTSVPMNVNLPDEATALLIERTGIRCMIVTSQSAEAMARLAPDLHLILPGTTTSERLPFTHAGLPPGRLYSLSFTSGSSGEPKGVCRSAPSLEYRLATFALDQKIHAWDRVPLLETISTGTCVNLVLNTLVAGAELAIIDLRRLGLAEALERLRRLRPTILSVVPSTFRTLFGVDSPAHGDIARGMRLVRLGGEIVRHEDVELYRSRFPSTSRLVVIFGAGETGLIASWTIEHDTALDGPNVPVGFPVRGVTLDLLREDGTAVAPGEIGEIVVASPGLASGYWRDERLTAERFSKSFDRPDLLRYHTGDFGRILQNGLLEYVGRRDRQIKISGVTIHPAEIEAVLSAIPGIAEVAVVAPVANSRPMLIAYYRAATADDLPQEQLQAWCLGRLPPALCPAIFRRLPEFPRLAGGKVDLRALAAIKPILIADATSSKAPDTLVAAIVRQVWISLLPEETFASNIAFDAAGGNSLLALDLVLRLEAALGRRLPFGLIDRRTRPGDIMERLQKGGQTSDTRPLVVFFPGILGADVNAADLFRALEHRFHFLDADPRDAGRADLGDCDPEQFFASVLAHAKQSERSRLWLAGYSLGARQAVEVARRLIAEGVSVEAVISLDGGIGANRWRPSPSPKTKSALKRWRNMKASHGRTIAALYHPVALRLARFAARRGNGRAIRLLARIGERIGSPTSSKWIAGEVTTIIRQAAFAQVPLGPLPMDLHLFLTDEPRPEPYRQDLGWTRQCRALQRVHIGGTHNQILNQPSLDLVVARMAELEVALRPGGPLGQG